MASSQTNGDAGIHQNGNHAVKFTRLPVHVRPSVYSIVLQPDLNKFTIAGQQTIDITVRVIALYA
jgi:hypothetical protein